MNESHMKSTGTTTVGIRCKDSVVLAADMRMTVGHMIEGPEAEILMEKLSAYFEKGFGEK